MNKIESALNKQINMELYSAYLYLGIAAKFEAMNLKGFAHWMKVQAKEEVSHATRIYNYMIHRGMEVKLESIQAPNHEWNSPLGIFEETYKHEKQVTGMIHNILKLAIRENDYPTQSMLQWFVDEQVEEESSADEILQNLKQIKDAPGGLFMLDKELAKRKE